MLELQKLLFFLIPWFLLKLCEELHTSHQSTLLQIWFSAVAQQPGSLPRAVQRRGAGWLQQDWVISLQDVLVCALKQEPCEPWDKANMWGVCKKHRQYVLIHHLLVLMSSASSQKSVPKWLLPLAREDTVQMSSVHLPSLALQRLQGFASFQLHRAATSYCPLPLALASGVWNWLSQMPRSSFASPGPDSWQQHCDWRWAEAISPSGALLGVPGVGRAAVCANMLWI